MTCIKASVSAVCRDVPPRAGTSAMRNETALEALRAVDFGPGREVFGFNQGTFSLIDLIEAAVSYTGPAHCTLATWTAAKAEMGHLHDWLAGNKLLSCRWLVDRSFLNRQPDLCEHLRNVFGDDCIRVARCHAKFVLLSNDDWALTLITSMNLNKNARIENYVLSSCPDMHREFSALVTRISDIQQPTDGFEGYREITSTMNTLAGGQGRKRKLVIKRDW